MGAHSTLEILNTDVKDFGAILTKPLANVTQCHPSTVYAFAEFRFFRLYFEKHLGVAPFRTKLFRF